MTTERTVGMEVYIEYDTPSKALEGDAADAFADKLVNLFVEAVRCIEVDGVTLTLRMADFCVGDQDDVDNFGRVDGIPCVGAMEGKEERKN